MNEDKVRRILEVLTRADETVEKKPQEIARNVNNEKTDEEDIVSEKTVRNILLKLSKIVEMSEEEWVKDPNYFYAQKLEAYGGTLYFKLRKLKETVNGDKVRYPYHYYFRKPKAAFDSEVMVVFDAFRNSSVVTSEEIDQYAEKIKLNNNSERIEKYIEENKDIRRNTYLGKGGVLDKVITILDAIKRKKKIKIQLYVYRYDGKTKKTELKLYKQKYIIGITVTPYRIVTSQGLYFLLAHDVEDCKTATKTETKTGRPKPEFKYYRVDFINIVEVLENQSTKSAPAMPDCISTTRETNKYLMQHPYLYGGETKTIIFRMQKYWYSHLVDWFGDSFQIVEEHVVEKKTTWDKENDRESTYDIKLDVCEDAFMFWAMQYAGCGVVVLSPTETRERMKKLLNDRINAYAETEAEAAEMEEMEAKKNKTK